MAARSGAAVGRVGRTAGAGTARGLGAGVETTAFVDRGIEGEDEGTGAAAFGDRGMERAGAGEGARGATGMDFGGGAGLGAADARGVGAGTLGSS